MILRLVAWCRPLRWPFALPLYLSLSLRWLFCLPFCLLLLSGCQPAEIVQQEAYVFGTRVEILVAKTADAPPTADINQAISNAFAEFERLHSTYHPTADSALSRLNKALAQGQSAKVSAELAGFIEETQTLSRRSQGLFDPGIGKLIGLWGFQSEESRQKKPDDAEILAWTKARGSILDLHLSPSGDSAAPFLVSSDHRQTQLDFGGYLKGVALDRAAQILKARRIHNALINIGGNVLALGKKGDVAWRVGIQDPRKPGIVALLDLADGEAVGTSGDYQRYFIDHGQRYCHILDPKSGMPIQHTRAVTVLIPASASMPGMLSDFSSKPLFLAGAADWQKMAAALDIRYALRIDADGQRQTTAAMQQRLKWLE